MARNNMASKQDMNRNPTGKGGFGDRPEDINRNGLAGWDPRQSQAYLLNKFVRMSDDEFSQWDKDNPSAKRTVAEVLARARVIEARKKLASYKEITNRTEGMPQQNTDLTSGGDKIEGMVLYKPEKKK